jgi:hypothetical protein
MMLEGVGEAVRVVVGVAVADKVREWVKEAEDDAVKEGDGVRVFDLVGVSVVVGVAVRVRDTVVVSVTVKVEESVRVAEPDGEALRVGVGERV